MEQSNFAWEPGGYVSFTPEDDSLYGVPWLLAQQYTKEARTIYVGLSGGRAFFKK